MGERYREMYIEEKTRKGILRAGLRAGNEARMIKRDRMAIAPERSKNNSGEEVPTYLLAFGGESRRFANFAMFVRGTAAAGECVVKITGTRL